MISVSVQRRGRGAFSLFWRDLDGEPHEQLMRGIGLEEAWKRAGIMENELNRSDAVIKDVAWKDFRRRVEAVYLADTKPKTVAAYRTALNSIERTIKPARMSDLTTESLIEYAATATVSRSSVKTYLEHLIVLLNWARKTRMIDRVPELDSIKISLESKGRPLSEEEFQRMIEATATVRSRRKDADAWIRLMRGIWLTGLRISEALVLEWESYSAPLSITRSGNGYRIIYRKHKNGKPTMERESIAEK